MKNQFNLKNEIYKMDPVEIVNSTEEEDVYDNSALNFIGWF